MFCFDVLDTKKALVSISPILCINHKLTRSYQTVTQFNTLRHFYAAFLTFHSPTYNWGYQTTPIHSPIEPGSSIFLFQFVRAFLPTLTMA